MIVCHCTVVTSGHIAAALDQGAQSVSEVCRRTGAAQSCATCVVAVKQVVCEHVRHGATDLEETARAAS